MNMKTRVCLYFMNMNNVFKYKCASNLQVKPQKSRYTREIPERASTCRARPTPRALRQLRRAPPALLRPRSTDRKEAAQQADCCRHTICYLTRCEFGEDEHDSGFTDTRWVAGARRAVRELRKSRLNSALKKHRKTEQEAADKAIVELEEGDDEA